MNKSDDIKDLSSALNKAQAMMEAAKKDSDNPFYKSKYADLHSVIIAIKEPLVKNDLSYTQTLDSDERGDYVVTTLMHSSGQWISGRHKLITSKFVKNKTGEGYIEEPGTMQSLGSAITYARRYSLQAIVGLSAEDDDAESTMQRPAQVKPPQAKVLSVYDQVKAKAQTIFKTPEDFQVWRTDNGLCDVLKDADDFELSRVWAALKKKEAAK